MNPVHIFPPYFFKIQSGNILASTLMSFKWSLPFKISDRISHLSSHFLRAVIAQSVQRWATGWMIGVLGFDSRWRLGIFLFTTAPRTALGPVQPPIRWVPGAPSLGVKRPGHELTTHLHLVQRSKNDWSYTSTPPIRLNGVVLS
jgi:hypothetical protein